MPTEARYDVATLYSSEIIAENVTASVATRLVNERGGAARVRFAGDTHQTEPVPWPLPLEVADA